ncbi:MAG: hypothetical protein H0W63_11645 [Gemmatimonadaceae bacterium]|nr:hypothetical protein [Gemmatimonadaceae bacterium]
MTSQFSELLPRAVGELEERWRGRKYTALEVRDFCWKLKDRMRSRDATFRPRLDALLAEVAPDPAVIAFDIDEIVENHDEGENYRDTLEGAYNMLDRAAAVPKEYARLTKLIVSVVIEARAEAAKSEAIASYLGDWIAPATWAREGIEIPTAGSSKASRSKSSIKSSKPSTKSSAKQSSKSSNRAKRKRR